MPSHASRPIHEARMMRRNLNRELSGVLLICLLMRLALVFGFGSFPIRTPFDGYVEIANNILAGKGFSPTPLFHFNIRTPSYPLLIAATWSLVPVSARYLSLELVQVGLSVATCALLYIIGRDVSGRNVGLAASVLFALSPSFTFFCGLVYAETFQVFLMTLAALLAIRLVRSPGLAVGVPLGLVWGIAGLNRPESTFLLPILLLPVLMTHQSRSSAKLIAVASAVFGKVIVMTPWVLRNYAVFGAFVLHVPMSGLGLFGGTYPHPPYYGLGWKKGPNAMNFTEGSEYRRIASPYVTPRYDRPGPAIVNDEHDLLLLDRDLAKAARANLVRYPRVQLFNATSHIYNLWSRPAASYFLECGYLVKLLWYSGFLVLMTLVGVGMLTAWKAGALGTIPLSWLILMFCHTGILILIVTEPRYQSCSAPFVFLFAGYGACASASRLLSRDKPDRGELGVRPSF